MFKDYKMRIRVITDSAADFPIDIMDKYDVAVVRHTVHFKEESWKIGQGISVKEYYAKLEQMDELPTNATPTLQEFQEIFQESLEEKKYDHIVYIALSDVLSGTANVARLAAKKFKDKITIFNTESGSGVQGLLLLDLIELLEKKTKLNKIITQLNELKDDYILVVGFHTLENVHKTGRFQSKFLLNLTKFIKIKPTVVMERPGKVVSKLPAFFSEFKMEKRLIKLVLKRAKKDKLYDVIISHVENEEGAERLIKKVRDKVRIGKSFITDASPIIGTNTGKGTIIVSLVPSLGNQL